MLYAKDEDGFGQASTEWWPWRDAQFSRSNMHSVGSTYVFYTQPNHIQPRSSIATWGGAVAAQVRPQMAVWMALFIEYSPAVQEVPVSIPGWDTTFSDALCSEIGSRASSKNASTSSSPTISNIQPLSQSSHPYKTGHATNEPTITNNWNKGNQVVYLFF